MLALLSVCTVLCSGLCVDRNLWLRSLVSNAVLSYTLGLRHAFDADHISVRELDTDGESNDANIYNRPLI